MITSSPLRMMLAGVFLVACTVRAGSFETTERITIETPDGTTITRETGTRGSWIEIDVGTIEIETPGFSGRLQGNPDQVPPSIRTGP